MYARIARFEGGDTSQLEAVIDGSRDHRLDLRLPAGGPGGVKAVDVVDRENARGLG